MTRPEVIGCSNRGRSRRVHPKFWPGRGFAIRAYRVKVTSGENSGEMLRGDHVVRTLERVATAGKPGTL